MLRPQASRVVSCALWAPELRSLCLSKENVAKEKRHPGWRLPPRGPAKTGAHPAHQKQQQSAALSAALLLWLFGKCAPGARCSTRGPYGAAGGRRKVGRMAGADAIRPPPVEVGVDARSVSINAGQLIKQKSVASAFQASEPTGFRETWEAKIVRGCLLVVCAGAMCLASLFGMGMFVIANIFCDSGPLARCFSIGLDFLEVGVSADVLLILVIFALQSPKKWAAWYLKAVPVISLAVFVAAIHWYQTFPMFCTTPVVLSALIAVLSIAYLILSRKEPLGSR